MITVLRQLPRNSRTIAAVSAAAISASMHHALDRGLDEHRLVEQRRDLDVRRQHRVDARQQSRFRLATMSSVEAPPFFSTESSTPRAPSWRTMLVCGAKPSRTWATSRR